MQRMREEITVLNHPTQGDNEQTVKLLLLFRAEIHAVNKNGILVLYIATIDGNGKIVELILLYEADSRYEMTKRV
jgi:ankyrin repeat protein